MHDGDRIPCINPRCGRTWKRTPGDGNEAICNKCFKLCPVERRRYRALKRRINHARRYPHKWTDEKVDQLYRVFNRNWNRMKRRFNLPEKPHGLEAFFEEMGWR